jgi:hypothetical protein
VRERGHGESEQGIGIGEKEQEQWAPGPTCASRRAARKNCVCTQLRSEGTVMLPLLSSTESLRSSTFKNASAGVYMLARAWACVSESGVHVHSPIQSVAAIAA